MAQRVVPALGPRIRLNTVSMLSAGIFLSAATLIFVPRAAATCTATLTLTKTDNGCVNLNITGSSGSCPNSPLELWLSFDGGGYVGQLNCPTSPCSESLSGNCFPCLQGTHTWSLEVTCNTTAPGSPAGACDIADTPGFDSKSFSFDHAPSITGVSANIDGGGPGLVSGSVTYHAPDAWTDNGLSVEWLGGFSSPSFFSSNGGGGPDYQAGFSASPDGSGATMLLLTVEACSDRKDSTVINVVDNDCGCPIDSGPPSGVLGRPSFNPSGSGPAACAGHPFRLSNGNMRMTDVDPLPGSEAISLARTYDSRGVAGYFGSGWTSMFDARLRTYSSQVLGTTFLEFRTASNSRYLFQNVSGGWLQMWPKGTRPAVVVPGAGTYTLREPGSAMETVFDASSGRVLLSRSRALGREADISYTSGFPSHVVDSWGNWAWTITADASSRVSSISVDGTSLLWTYIYDGSGNLATVTGPSSAAWRSYTYSNGLLTASHDAPGHLIESHAYTFNSGVFRTGSSLADQDDITSVTYLLSGRDNFEKITRTTAGTGATTDYYTRVIAGRPRTVQVVGHCASCGTNDAVYAYDLVNGHLLRDQDARGYITVRTFDASDRVLTTAGPYQPTGCDPLTDSNHCRQTPTSLQSVALTPTVATLTATYAYGDTNWPDVATFVSTTSVLDPNQSRSTAVQLDPATGAVTQQVVSGLTGEPAQAAQFTSTATLYDGSEGAAFNPGGAFDSAWMSLPQPPGLRKSSDGPRTDVADVTTSVYYPIDTSVPALLRGHLAAVRDAAGNVTRFENYDVFGNIGRTVDANSVATESTFDSMGRVLTSTLKGVAGCDTNADPLCATDLVSSRTYQPALGPLASTTMPGGGTTTYEYDTRGRTSATTRQVTSTAYERIEYDYDPATGRKSAERYLAGHPGSWTVTRSDAFQYDTFARLSEIDHPDGSKVIYHYDGANNLTSVQDERHSTANTTYAYDPTNRLASVTQTLSTASSGQIVTAYTYDIHGNLTSVTDPNGNTTTYLYDDFARMLHQVSSVSGTTTYSYDPAGNLTSTTDANSATTARVYDSLNRVLSATSSRAGLDTEVVSYTYDGTNQGSYGLGRLSTMDGTSYRYERRGLLAAVADDDGLTLTGGYDPDGNRRSLGYPSGRVATYNFDFAGRPVTASFDGAAVVNSASYLPFGPMTSLAYGNGTTKMMLYDARYRPQENKLTTATAVIADYLYQEDAGGNITQIHDATSAAYNRDFGYDDLNRLTTANSGASLWGNGGYQYDDMGNMTSLHIGSRSLSFSYVGTTPRIQSMISGSTQTTVQYDNVGNELLSGIYSARNLLHPGGGDQMPDRGQSQQAQFTYDGREVRISASVTTPGPPPWGGTTTRRSIYSPELNLLAQYDSSGMLLDGASTDGTEYLWFGGQPIAQAFTDPSLPTRYTFTDHLGTPLLQTDPGATIAWRGEYEPYGSIFAYRVGDDSDPQALRLPGQEATDPIVGLEYNIFRWYRGEWGRYSQADPLALGGLGFFSDSDLLTFQTLPVRRQRRVEPDQPPKRYAVVEPPYTYAAANPVNFIDPSGLSILPCVGGGTSRIPDYIDPETKKPRRTKTGKLVGQCLIILACVDPFPPMIRFYTTTVTHVAPCPPCPGPMDCLGFLDTDTGALIGRLACTK